jgi:type II secretory pathway component PulF
MAVTGRIPDVVLAAAFQRLAIAVAAGLDLRRAWAAEVGRVPARWRPAFAAVAAQLDAGSELGAAAAASRGAIPDAVSGMLLVGDRTGRVAEVLEQTAMTLSRGVVARRGLRRALTGPAIRLVMATLAIVALIAVSGPAAGPGGTSFDGLGVGLVGRAGAEAAIGAILVAAAAVAMAGVVARASWRSRGWAWRAARRLPVVGPAVVAAEAAAWCRAAALAAHAGLGVGELVELASRVAAGLGLDRRRVESQLRGGRDLPEALADAGRLPQAVIEAVAVGEATGTTAEALDRMADDLDAAAARGLAGVVQAVGLLAWALAACLVAAIVIRVAATYARMLGELTRPP